jgi:hypothetical protein
MDYLMDDIIVTSNMPTDEDRARIVSDYLTTNIKDEEDMMLAYEYLSHLDAYDKIALSLSIGLLGTSFDLLKSNGYIDWLQTLRKQKKE